MDCVKVALRIRPLVQSEIQLGCKTCVQRVPNEPQVSIGKGSQMFRFNYVFDENEGQTKVYDMAVKSLVDNLFKGYNVTILAYGQTGSGKTYSMGTNYSGEGELGVIPRAIYDIFNKVKAADEKDFRLTVSFIELYNESLYDLLTQRPREQSVVDLREQGTGLCIPGLTEVGVRTPEETLLQLREGSLGRVVGATAMNAESSRSHAIITINMEIRPKDNPNEITTSKFHLVDLAGSERSKKTGATGDRFREGVNINKGLLVLGNVISQLGEGNVGFINYRDSKLTRLLQDSLGGNSVTLMIACISPADYNQDETVSTLRYADRARKIKNKPIINQDPILAEMMRLKKENGELRLQIIGEGKAFECPPEHKMLQSQLCETKKKMNQLSKAMSELLTQNTIMQEKALSLEHAETTLKEKLGELKSFSESFIEDDPKLIKLKNLLNDVETEQKKIETQKISFDKNAEHEVDDIEDDLEADGGVISERRNEHILSQSKINKELLTLTKNLMWKEELFAKLTDNTGHLPGVSEESINLLKQQLAELQQEKNELLEQIRLTSTSQNNSSKNAETRRKRLQELETKVSALTKKVQEQERVIKTKERSDEKIMTLRQEIHAMKQMKVKLIQQMKNENEKFKTFKAVIDREVCQLKTQNQRKQNQLRKMEQMHSSQQNVLRRKLEAAAAANKRIMAVLEKQKAARSMKNKGLSTDHIRERIMEEMELLESEYEAQKSLENLLQDRASLTKELSVIKESLLDDNVSKEEKNKLRTDLKQVEEDLEFRSVEICDLQQKLLDIQQDERNRNNWDTLRSMADAKFALSHIFKVASEKIKENLNNLSILSDLKEHQAETDQQLSECLSKLGSMEACHQKSLEKIEKEYEEKVYVFMKLASENLEKANEGKILEALTTQLQKFEELELLRKKIEELEEENGRLSSNGNEATSDPYKKFLDSRMNSTFSYPDKKKTSQTRKPRDTFALADEETLKAFDSSMEHDTDDLNNDPDWRKTPIAKRLKALKKGKLGKRGSDEERCSCSGLCKLDCPCSKSFSPCNENCRCDKSECSAVKRSRPTNSWRLDLDSDDKPEITNAFNLD